MQPDGGGAERVGLDDIRAGFEVLGMNFLDDLRLSKKQKLEAAFEIFAFPIAKPFAAIIALGKFVALDHRAHGAVDDAFAQERFQGTETICCHDCPGTKERFPG